MPQLKDRESDQRTPGVSEQRVFTKARDREAEREQCVRVCVVARSHQEEKPASREAESQGWRLV